MSLPFLPVVDPVIREQRQVDLRGGTAIVAFPGIGLASTLAAAYLSSSLKLKAVGALDFAPLPPVAIIEGGQVVDAVRILARSGKRASARRRHPIVVFMSEVPLVEEGLRPVATAILAWCATKGIALVVGLESTTGEVEPGEVGSVRLWGVADHPSANARLAKAGLPILQEGVVGGLAGALLAHGIPAPFEVVALVETCRASEPDVRGAATLVEFLVKFLDLPVPLGRLRRDTAEFDRQLKEVERRRHHAAEVDEGPESQDFV